MAMENDLERFGNNYCKQAIPFFKSFEIGELLSYLFLDYEKISSENKGFSNILKATADMISNKVPSCLFQYKKLMPCILVWCTLLALSKEEGSGSSSIKRIINLGKCQINIYTKPNESCIVNKELSGESHLIIGLLHTLGFDKSIIESVCFEGIEFEILAKDNYLLEIIPPLPFLEEEKQQIIPSLHPKISSVRLLNNPKPITEHAELILPSIKLVTNSYFHALIEFIIPLYYFISLTIENNKSKYKANQKFYVLTDKQSENDKNSLIGLYELVVRAAQMPGKAMEPLCINLLSDKKDYGKNRFKKIKGFISVQNLNAIALKGYANNIRDINKSEEIKIIKNSRPINNIILHNSREQIRAVRMPMFWERHASLLHSKGISDVTLISEPLKREDNLIMFKPNSINHCYHGGHISNIIFAARHDDKKTEIHEYLSPVHCLGKKTLFQKLAEIIDIKYVRRDLLPSKYCGNIVKNEKAILCNPILHSLSETGDWFKDQGVMMDSSLLDYISL